MTRLTAVTLVAAVSILFSTGCKSEDASSSSPAAKRPAAAGSDVLQKPTPEQEAAKQRAIQQGPAIEAANDAARAAQEKSK